MGENQPNVRAVDPESKAAVNRCLDRVTALFLTRKERMRSLTTVLLLTCSNLFMTYAWYGHLRDLKGRPLLVAIMASWSVAFFEYCLQVPANRIGFQSFSLPQLKVMQEIITMCVFAGFATLYMKERLRLDFLYAGLCLIAAAYFMFRSRPIA